MYLMSLVVRLLLQERSGSVPTMLWPYLVVDRPLLVLALAASRASQFNSGIATYRRSGSQQTCIPQTGLARGFDAIPPLLSRTAAVSVM